MITLTKDERYEIYRLAKRARGLYKAEKQALVFIGEAQTMQDGVCRKALKSAEDLGFGARQIRFGLHGRRRDGKIEFPGLLARGIVSVVRNENGGRAPGGHGLPAAYAINRDVLLTFVPEMDDPTKWDEPKAEPSSNEDEPLGEPREELMPPSSCSSLSSSIATSHRAASDPARESSPRRGEVVIVDDDDAGSQSPHDPGRARSSEEEKNNPKSAGKENQDQPQPETLEARAEQIISSSRQRQLDRKVSVAEIYREFKAVFDRLVQGRKIYLTWTPPAESHKQRAAELYRAIGRDAALSKWEQFLIAGEHDVPQREFDQESGRYITCEVQRTWLLLCFVNEYSVPAE